MIVLAILGALAVLAGVCLAIRVLVPLTKPLIRSSSR